MVEEIEDAERIIIIISPDNDFFYDCVAENINIPKFKLAWQDYSSSINEYLSYLQVFNFNLYSLFFI